MIYRKWSLLTGPTSILAGIIGSVAVVNFVVFGNDPFGTKEKKNTNSASSDSSSSSK